MKLNIWALIALVAVVLLALDFSPLIPKAIRFMDDVHTLRARAEEIQQSLEKLNHRWKLFGDAPPPELQE